ncbi:hypothetical protein UF64_16030 [Thalassospira sp. HJ]|uniref:hypothetical protein n=1 Tax=Thalassospira sp. HJ TaxID=1616823 RepID=UPI0005CE49D1|nr:hypothetical protein [Thalassospira sp. HJ]KJE33957.1 hypothetical protein UF64_16030 [Thalassospira sp. HJ]
MTKDLRNFPYRVVIHEKHSAQGVLDWLDVNVLSKNWTMGIRNIEIPRGDSSDPIVDMVIYFNRREDMERFRDKWAGKTREHKVKLHGWRAALYALFHLRTEMVAYEKAAEPKAKKPDPAKKHG